MVLLLLKIFINLIINKGETVPFYSNECKFISQDCLHLKDLVQNIFQNYLKMTKTLLLINFYNNSDQYNYEYK